MATSAETYNFTLASGCYYIHVATGTDAASLNKFSAPVWKCAYGTVVDAPTIAQNSVNGLVLTVGLTDNSDNESGFTCQYTTDGVTYTTGGTAAANAATVDVTVPASGTYDLRCKADHSEGGSVWSNELNWVVS